MTAFSSDEQLTHEAGNPVELFLPDSREKLLKRYGIQGRLGQVYPLAGRYMQRRQEVGKPCYPVQDNGLYSGEGAEALFQYALPYAEAAGQQGPILYGIDIDNDSLRMSRATLGHHITSGGIEIMKMDATQIIPTAFSRKSNTVTCIEVLGIGLTSEDPEGIERLFAGISDIATDDATVFLTFLNQHEDERMQAHANWTGDLKGVPLAFNYMDELAEKYFGYRDWYGQMILTDLGDPDEERGWPGGTAWPYRLSATDPAQFYLPSAFTPRPVHTLRHQLRGEQVVPVETPIYYIGAFSRDPNVLLFPNAHIGQDPEMVA